MALREEVSASREKLGAKEALALARGASRVVAAKGRKIVVFDLKRDPPDDAALLAVLLGPTGNLRAPALCIGATLIVGFDEETYREYFG